MYTAPRSFQSLPVLSGAANPCGHPHKVSGMVKSLTQPSTKGYAYRASFSFLAFLLNYFPLFVTLSVLTLSLIKQSILILFSSTFVSQRSDKHETFSSPRRSKQYACMIICIILSPTQILEFTIIYCVFLHYTTKSCLLNGKF